MAQDDLPGSDVSFQDAGVSGLGAALVNLSPGGCCLRFMLFELPAALTRGSLLSSLKLLHPSLDRRPIRGRIAWRTDASPHALIGVQFLDMHQETLASIHRFLEASLSREGLAQEKPN